jgi:hypothetical protein
MRVERSTFFWGLLMRMIDWDWPAQLETCQSKIAELEEKIASQRRKIQRLLDQKMNAAHAQRLLAIREQSLERVQSDKYLIEIRMADRAADHAAAVGTLPLDLQLRQNRKAVGSAHGPVVEAL